MRSMLERTRYNGDDNNGEPMFGTKSKVTAVITAAGTGLIAFASMRYRIAKPSQYIVRTGIFIPKVAVDKKAFQWPFQTAKTISVQPSNYTFHLQAMSKEKMEFILPGVYTVGPKDEMESLITYATLLGNTTEQELTSIIKGIIEGETRVLTASLSLEDIFSGRDAFRDDVTARINKEMANLGLTIINANIQEMSDHEGSEYFKFLRQRARANAENEARINVAEAQKRGDIEVKERQRDTRIKTAGFEAEAVLFENERNAEVAQSNAQLKIQEAEFDKRSKVAQIESQKAAASREAALQREVETLLIAQNQERVRSEMLVKATVESEAKERIADADLYATKAAADADLYSRKAEATGILARFQAESEGLEKLLQTSDNPSVAMQYLMIDRKLFPEMANANAKAIQGLQPKITYWNTGDSGKNPITDVVKNIPPLVDTIFTQTGMQPPSWLMDASKYLESEKAPYEPLSVVSATNDKN